MLEKLDNSVFSNNMFFHNVDSNVITFISNDMGFNMGLVIIILMKNILKLKTWRNRFKQNKVYKKDKSKELMPVAWHQTR